MGKYDTLMDINIMQGQRARAGKYNVMYRRNVQVCNSAHRPTKSHTRFLLTCCRPSNPFCQHTHLSGSMCRQMTWQSNNTLELRERHPPPRQPMRQ